MKHKYHQPKKIGASKLKLDFNKFAEKQAEAEYALGLLEGSQKKLQNSKLLISPLTAKEAAVSSKIEGTQSTVSDVFLHEAGGRTKYMDIKEVINYRNAMTFAIARIKQSGSLNINLIKSLHKILLKNTRHRGKLGDFRKKDVWIAEKEGDPIEKAIYIPPHFTKIDEYVQDLWSYVDNPDISALLKAGIIHYQFEAVHPFEDGNGRIGRLLIPLILMNHKRLSEPILYISGYMEKNRDTYISKLHQVDETGDFESWLNFFFESVAVQVQETQEIVEKIYSLYDEIKNEFTGSKSPYLSQFLDFIFSSPMFTIPRVRKELKCQRLTARNLITGFQDKGFIVESGVNYDRAKLYSFNSLLKIIR